MKAESSEYRKVPRSLLWWCWLKFMFLHMTCQTFDKGYTNAFTASLMPVLRYLYKGRPDADEQIKAGLMRTRSYYVCEQSFSGVVFSIIVGLEEKKCNGQMSGEMISATRTGIMGPLSALGDTLHGSTTRQIAIALTLAFCLDGRFAGALLMFLLMNVSPFLTAFLGVPRVYDQGSAFVLKLLENGALQRFVKTAGGMTVFIMGGIAGKYLFSHYMLHGLFAIISVAVYYVLLQKKIRTNRLIFGTVAGSILLSVIHIAV